MMKTIRVNILATSEEKIKYKQFAQSQGLQLSPFIRQLIIKCNDVEFNCSQKSNQLNNRFSVMLNEEENNKLNNLLKNGNCKNKSELIRQLIQNELNA